MNSMLLNPVKVHIVIHYKHDGPEHYDLLISPFAAGRVWVRLRCSAMGELSCRLHPWPTDGHDSVSLRTLHTVIACFFGDVHPAPRIVGAPDWTRVALEISTVRDHKPRRLLLLEMAVDGPSRASFARHVGAKVLRDGAVRMCPEDADPVYAITRLGLSGKNATLAQAAGLVEAPASTSGFDAPVVVVEPGEVEVADVLAEPRPARRTRARGAREPKVLPA
jgi:hypothetical protein